MGNPEAHEKGGPSGGRLAAKPPVVPGPQRAEQPPPPGGEPATVRNTLKVGAAGPDGRREPDGWGLLPNMSGARDPGRCVWRSRGPGPLQDGGLGHQWEPPGELNPLPHHHPPPTHTHTWAKQRVQASGVGGREHGSQAEGMGRGPEGRDTQGVGGPPAQNNRTLSRGDSALTRAEGRLCGWGEPQVQTTGIRHLNK